MKKQLVILFIITFIICLIAIYFPRNIKNNAKQQLENTSSAVITQTISRSIIGIHYRMIDKQTALQNNLVEGAYVTQVIKNSPAEKTGLQEEDIITEIDGRKIAGLQQESIYNLISTLKPKSQVNLSIWRNKLIKSFTITLE